MPPYPAWLPVLAWLYIAICLACALALAIHTLLRPQKMAIMGVVWPITALYLGPFAVWMYGKALPFTRKGPTSPAMKAAVSRHKDDPPTLFQNSIAVFHCGAGCSLGDLIAESIVPALGIAFAGAFGSKLILDFAFAYILGIVFQYFTIVPMRGLSFGKGIIAAARADTISIALFEVGMFAWMAVTYYLVFPAPHLAPGMAVFWFMMQIAMIVGTLTALPANAWLIRKGWKEKMPQLDPSQMHDPGPTHQDAGSTMAA
ncbi:MAG TPA: DUF4396 domain-containing protein [Acidobacteriaceae bacterium]